jgi:signal peptidase I
MGRIGKAVSAMTSEDAPAASPWLTTWFKPRQSITHVINADPRHHVWLLAALGLIFGIILQLLVNGWATALLDWRAIAGIVIGGAILGVIGLYYSGFFFRWAGALFGGHATAVEVRAALAWGQLPTVLGGVVGLVVGLLLLGAGVSNLVIGIIAGVAWFWTLVLTWLMFARVQDFGFWRTIISAGLGWVSSLSVLLIFALAFRALAFQPFYMPAGSMMPSLRIGDHFVVSKWPYGYSRYTFYNLIPFSGRIFPAEPRRGDVVVFKLPRDNSTDYIKRVVGLPGDEITVRGGVLLINGKEVPRRRIADFVTREDGGRPRDIPAYEETLPNGVKYTVLEADADGPFDNVGPFKVPAGHFFMMGDNRDNSSDSRASWAVGYVPFENLIGRAALLSSMSPERFGTTVR